MAVTRPFRGIDRGIKAVDPDLANALTKLQTHVETRRALESDASMVWKTYVW